MKTLNIFIVCIVCITCIVCIPFIAPSQVQDDFSDGNFTKNPEWIGDTSQFKINAAGQLQLNSAGSDTSWLFTRSSPVKKTEWSFWMKLSFNTSANNHARIYLTADTTDFHFMANSCFLQAGGGDDAVYIMKQTGTVVSSLFKFKSYKMDHSTNAIRIKIIRDDSGHWEARIDTTGGYNYINDGTFFDDSFSTCRWFGIMCRYTSSNVTKFYFDDFYVGPVIYDTISPRVISQSTTSAKVFQVVFSEPVQKQVAEDPGNYQIRSEGTHPESVVQDPLHPDRVSIFLLDSLANGTIDSLRIRNIMDLSGNRLTDTIVQVFYYRPEAYDILIHEIMADPDPPEGLPNGEYVELYNRSDFPVNLKDWTFKYGSYSKVFPLVTIPSKGYLLIVRDPAFMNIAECVILFTSSTSLSNEGTTLVLKNAGNHVIHSVSYTPDWYRGSFKKEGGWSLEMIDSSNPCGCQENWGASKDGSGGSPGRRNSVAKANPDLKEPVTLRAFISDSLLVEVTFSEAMDSLSLLSPASWEINHSDGMSKPLSIVAVPPEFKSAVLMFDKPFERGVLYMLTVTGEIKDCSGNSCVAGRSVRFALPDSVTIHDVVINEILSNPASGGSRFVELYNRSDKVVDLQTMVMANRDTITGFLPNAVPLTPAGYLLFPGDYVAMTSNSEDICDRYHPVFPEAITGMKGFPVFGDDTGTVIIARKDNLAIVDRLQYNPDMHYPLLATAEGVSLERANPELTTEVQSNWHSAAETAGFATPGYRNSTWIKKENDDQEVMIQPAIFSPDNDGRDDLLIITIREHEPDYAVNIVVYDPRGRFVRQLANNVVFGGEGIFIWDGMTAARSKAPIGFYILLIELTRPDGTVRKIKKTAILGGRL
ncbi:MAG: lamin tail domain-containing protein [Bacteroidales bacterium]|nr:lamin tail domain-containing protein [Bacteroidales bacterium]